MNPVGWAVIGSGRGACAYRHIVFVVGVITVCVLGSVFAGAIPPLSDAQSTALRTAFDGRDHREAAFDALLENAREWGDSSGDAPIILHPDFDALTEAAGGHRGDLFRIIGRIDQIEWMRDPWVGVAAWFIRNDSGLHALVYLAARDDAAEDRAATFRLGDKVEVIARFYKPIDATGRDGVLRRYPAFVGSISTVVRAGGSDPSGASFLVVIVPIIILLGVLFLIVFVISRRSRRITTPKQGLFKRPNIDEFDEEDELPDDPAAALEMLEDRSRVD